MVAIALTYLALAATVFAPVDRQGAEAAPVTLRSAALGERTEINVVVPAAAAPRGKRPLLVFLHGRGGSEETFVDNAAVFEGLEALGRRAPVVAFPDGGDHGYWHDRDDGDWGRYVMREVIPTVSRRFGVEPGRVAIGGISMGGFGAYDLALLHAGRFCAVVEGADFARHDVVGRVRRDPDAFGPIPVWNDYGSADPFRAYDEGFVDYLERGDADLRAHSWRGGHDNDYWNRHWPAYLRFYAGALANCG